MARAARECKRISLSNRASGAMAWAGTSANASAPMICTAESRSGRNLVMPPKPLHVPLLPIHTSRATFSLYSEIHFLSIINARMCLQCYETYSDNAKDSIDKNNKETHNVSADKKPRLNQMHADCRCLDSTVTNSSCACSVAERM